MATNSIEKLDKQPVIKRMIESQKFWIIWTWIAFYSKGLNMRQGDFRNSHTSFKTDCAFFDQSLTLKWASGIFTIVIGAEFYLRYDLKSRIWRQVADNTLTLILSDDVRSIEGMPSCGPDQQMRPKTRVGNFIKTKCNAVKMCSCCLKFLRTWNPSAL